MKKLASALLVMLISLTGTALASGQAATAQEAGKSSADATANSPAKRAQADKQGKKKKKVPSFEECDKNKDGVLSLEEALACYHPKVSRQFARMDADKDGNISKDELKAYKAARKKAREAKKQK